MDEPVLLTGAGGRVGQAILRGIGDDYEWRLLDREPLPATKVPVGVTDADQYVADITNADAVREAMEGVGAVIHLAGDPRKTAPWDSVLRNNIDGTQVVMRAAVDAGVKKFAFASSNHAVGGYETEDRTPDLYRPPTTATGSTAPNSRAPREPLRRLEGGRGVARTLLPR